MKEIGVWLLAEPGLVRRATLATLPQTSAVTAQPSGSQHKCGCAKVPSRSDSHMCQNLAPVDACCDSAPLNMCPATAGRERYKRIVEDDIVLSLSLNPAPLTSPLRLSPVHSFFSTYHTRTPTTPCPSPGPLVLPLPTLPLPAPAATAGDLAPVSKFSDG